MACFFGFDFSPHCHGPGSVCQLHLQNPRFGSAGRLSACLFLYSGAKFIPRELAVDGVPFRQPVGFYWVGLLFSIEGWLQHDYIILWVALFWCCHIDCT